MAHPEVVRKEMYFDDTWGPIQSLTWDEEAKAWYLKFRIENDKSVKESIYLDCNAGRLVLGIDETEDKQVFGIEGMM